MSIVRILGRRNSINVQKCIWLATELDVNYVQEDYGGAYPKVDASLNPNQLIPVLVDDTNGLVLWESNSICRYIASKSKSTCADKMWPRDEKEKANIDKFLDWQLTTMYPPVRTIFLTLIRTAEKDRNMGELEKANVQAAAVFQTFNKILSDKRLFTASNNFTVADIPLAITAHRWIQLSDKEYHDTVPYVMDWYSRICKRGAFQQHVSTLKLT